jgi:O-antigen/teichoic acid export membrane protein
MLVNQPGGFSEMAVYNIATQWRQLVLFLPAIAAQVFLPILSAQAQSGHQSSEALYKNINMIIAAPFVVLLSAVSPLIMALYGKSFMAEWPVFVVVQFAALAQIIQSPAVTSWAVNNRMWTNFLANLFWGTSLVVTSWALIDLGALGLGLALLFSFLVYFGIISVVNPRITNGTIEN